MNSFNNLTHMDRRKFLAGFLATAASAGVLGNLGLHRVTEEQVRSWFAAWTRPEVLALNVSFSPDDYAVIHWFEPGVGGGFYVTSVGNIEKWEGSSIQHSFRRYV